ncbi:MAG: prolipoprotein diacylglyceryl transferase [Bdellovibrionales bacterium]|nr:prolipoprotein diacylglyceryl transferase [Bdellovibrionales bacterium]
MKSSFVHHFDPFAIEFTWSPLVSIFGEGVGIRWYGLAYLTGFLCAYLVVLYMAKKGTIELKPEKVGDFITYGAIGTMVGGRLGYAFFYAPELLWTIHAKFPYWGVLEVHKGGMASHGGILGIVVACFLYAKVNKLNPLQLIDLTSLMGGVGIFFGRMANFVNGELFGRVCDEGYRWAVKFPTEMYYWASYKVDKLKSLEPAAMFIGKVKNGSQEIIVDHDKWSYWVDRYQFGGLSKASVDYVIHKSEVMVQAGNQEMINIMAQVLSPRYPSQIFQGLLEGLCVFVLLSLFWMKPRKPGMITAAFGFLYSLARILGEQYRMPDAFIGFELFGLTRGQWLSFGLLGIAVVFFIIAWKSKSQPSGGFSK